MSSNDQVQGPRGGDTDRSIASLDTYRDDTASLKLVLQLLWRRKLTIAGATLAFFAISVAIALWLPNQYRSSVILAPATMTSTSALTQLAGEFGGLASLAGISLGGSGSNNKATIAIELVKTWDFLDRFISENGLEVELFAVRGWDRSDDRLLIDEGVYDSKNEVWVREVDSANGETPEPSSWELYKEFVDRIAVKEDVTTGLITLTVEYYSPVIAKEWAEKLVAAINGHMRLQDREDTLKSIQYLQRQIDQTSLAEMRAVFYQIIEEQTKKLMLTEVSDEYVLKTISPARTPEEKSKPQRSLIVIGGTLAGLVLALLMVFAQSALSASSDREE